MFRLLLITAHPDDEASSFGGALQMYRDKGVETHCICLTPGQAASNRGGATSDDELSEMRRKEFAAACELLRISKYEVLNFRDGKLAQENFYEVVGELVRRVRQIRPHVMFTFGGEGAVTAHPDHTMASLFATAAFHWAGHTNRYPEQLEKDGLKPHITQKLYYASYTFHLEGRQPVSLAPRTAVLEVSKYVEKKIAAFELHTSQSPLFTLFRENVAKREGKEFFHLVAARNIMEAKVETDLFEGVEE